MNQNDAFPKVPSRQNRLSTEKSPYLLQHAKNSVDWYPWGEEAFARALREEKPVFLSIGYATCHWCHVMAHESFEDPHVAALLNRYFVCIKVDREERPDIDSIYMTICQMMTGQGGWPLTIIMTPEKKPFFAATYLPKESTLSMTGMLDLIPRIATLWLKRRNDLSRLADEITAALNSGTESKDSRNPDKTLLVEGYEELVLRFDTEYGGFGSAPKFPMPPTLLFLLRYWYRTGNPRALAMVEKTLDAIRNGGVFDHIGGGVHRYSTDAQWRVPHFEKMLYDQALLAMAYTETYQVTRNPAYRQSATEIISYVLRDLASSEGVFFSAEDADNEGGEGAFYLWTSEELTQILGDKDAAIVLNVYNARPEGNILENHPKNGKNILFLTASLQDLYSTVSMDETTFQSRMEAIRKVLFHARQKRPRPPRDDKVLTDWNGLFISTLARTAQVSGNRTYCEKAERAMQFILTRMRNSDGGLLHRYREQDAAIEAFGDDYACIIRALIDLYEATFNLHYLSSALELNSYFITHFWDNGNSGFFNISDKAEMVLVRKKEIYDGAIPSCNSVAFENLLRLARLTGDAAMEKKASELAQSFAGMVRKSPSAHAWFLCSLNFALGPSQEVVIVGQKDADDTQKMINVLRAHYFPSLVVLYLPSKGSMPDMVMTAPFMRELSALDGRATAYVCSKHSCAIPTTDPEKMLEVLSTPMPEEHSGKEKRQEN